MLFRSLGRGEDDGVGFFGGEEVVDGLLVGEIEFGVGVGEEVGVVARLQCADDGGACESAVAGDVDFGVFIHAALVLWGTAGYWWYREIPLGPPLTKGEGSLRRGAMVVFWDLFIGLVDAAFRIAGKLPLRGAYANACSGDHAARA